MVTNINCIDSNSIDNNNNYSLLFIIINSDPDKREHL